MTHRNLKMLLCVLVVLFFTQEVLSQSKHINLTWSPIQGHFSGKFEGAQFQNITDKANQREFKGAFDQTHKFALKALNNKI